MAVAVSESETRSVRWTRRHLLDLEDLSAAEIRTILDTAEQFVDAVWRLTGTAPGGAAFSVTALLHLLTGKLFRIVLE